MRRIVFMLAISLLLAGIACAGELVAQEAITYYKEGVKAQKGSNFEAADVSYKKCLLVDPSNRNWKKYIFNNYGIMYAKQGDMESAEKAFNEALKIDPDYLPAKLNLGFVYDKRRTELEAIKYWLKALNIDLNQVRPKDFVIEDLENRPKPTPDMIQEKTQEKPAKPVRIGG